MQIRKISKVVLSLLVAIALTAISTLATAAWSGDVVSSSKTSQKIIALTFDDGPHAERTPEILDILAGYGIHATFFVVGDNVKAHPDIIQREIDEGHEIGNHTCTHSFLKSANRTDVLRELCSFDDIMFELFEYKPKLFRPPGGLYNKELCEASKEAGYTVVLWSVDTRDWAHTPTSKVCKEIEDKASSGDIVLMHDYINGSSPTPAALRVIIPKLLDDGYKFVTVSELMEVK